MPLLHLIQDLQEKDPGRRGSKGCHGEGGRGPRCEGPALVQPIFPGLLCPSPAGPLSSLAQTSLLLPPGLLILPQSTHMPPFSEPQHKLPSQEAIAG